MFRYLTLIVLALLALASCVDEAPDTSSPCGSGEQVGEGCVFDGTLIIEGFLCPEDAPHRHDFQGEVACTAGEELPDGYVEEMRAAGYEATPLEPGTDGGPCLRDGAAVAATDGCNSCECVDGAWGCTDLDSCGADDPCLGVELPACPPECTQDVQPGAACTGTASCGNEIGDGCTCDGATWSCTVHPPLGQGCNLVCRR